MEKGESNTHPLEDTRTLVQPTQQFKVKLTVPRHAAIKAIDDWLSLIFGDKLPSSPELAQSAIPDVPKFVTEMAWRLLLLIRFFLQFAWIPAFDAGHVSRIARENKNSTTWVVEVNVVSIGLVRHRCYVIAVRQAVKCLEWIATNPKTAKNVEQLYNFIQSTIIDPLKKMRWGGKSTLPILRRAYRQDIPFFHLGTGIYQLGWGCKARRMDRSSTDRDSAIGSRVTRDKRFSANLLRMAGLPAPEHLTARDTEAAIKAARSLGWPVVVKPVDREMGLGVTVNVTDTDELTSAFELARQASNSKTALIEKQADGVCHRLFIYDGELLFGVKRLPKSVVADGQRTVLQLIDEANLAEQKKAPWVRSSPFPKDELAMTALSAAGYSLETVPPAGQPVPLRLIESHAAGGYPEDVTTVVHPENLAIARAATTVMGLDVAGVDIISSDITRPWYETGSIINEVNFAPFFGVFDLSERAIPVFLKRLIDKDGRIPVDAIIGGNAALIAARAQQQQHKQGGINCFVTSHATTLNPDGSDRFIPMNSLCDRIRALLVNPKVERIILVVQTDEMLTKSLPIDRISQLTVTSGDLVSSKDERLGLSPSVYKSVIDHLRGLMIERNKVLAGNVANSRTGH